MSCTNCTKGFSLFTREHGCPSCGFSFCSSCLKYVITLKDNKGSKQVKVCLSCLTKEQNKDKVSKQVEAPPEALQKRLAKQPLPMSLTQRDQKPLKKGVLGSEDQKIAERLSALHKERQEMTNLPSEEEVRDRLDRLKGMKSRPDNTAHYNPPDQRSSGQKADDLFTALSAEVELEAKVPILTPEQEIAARLAKLRGESLPLSVHNTRDKNIDIDPSAFLDSDVATDIDNMSMDEVAKLMETVGKDVQLEANAALTELEKDKAIQEQLERLRVRPSKKKSNPEETSRSESPCSESEDRVLAQILAEVRLEDRLSPLPPEFPPMAPPEELPWCVICNADAVLRCVGCEGDLYCRGCYKEGHKGEDLVEHSTEQFKK